MSTLSIETVPALVGGEWRTFDATRSGEVFNPSTGEVIARVPLMFGLACAKPA